MKILDQGFFPILHPQCFTLSTFFIQKSKKWNHLQFPRNSDFFHVFKSFDVINRSHKKDTKKNYFNHKIHNADLFSFHHYRSVSITKDVLSNKKIMLKIFKHYDNKEEKLWKNDNSRTNKPCNWSCLMICINWRHFFF